MHSNLFIPIWAIGGDYEIIGLLETELSDGDRCSCRSMNQSIIRQFVWARRRTDGEMKVNLPGMLLIWTAISINPKFY